MDQREFRSYMGMPHFHPERNVINGIDVCKNGRFVNQIRNKIGPETSNGLGTRAVSGGSGEPTQTAIRSPSLASQSSSATSIQSLPK